MGKTLASRCAHGVVSDKSNGHGVRFSPQDSCFKYSDRWAKWDARTSLMLYIKKYNVDTSHICYFRNGACFYRWIRRIAGMRTEAPSPDFRIAGRLCGLHRRFGYRRFPVSPVWPIAGFVLEGLSPEFPSPEPHSAGRSIAGRFLMCYRRASKPGDETRRYQATSQIGRALSQRKRQPPTPPAVGPWCRRNLIPRRPKLQQNQTRLPDPNPKPPPAGFGGVGIAWSDANPHPGPLPLGR